MAKQDRMLEHSCIFEMLTMGMCVGIGDVDVVNIGNTLMSAYSRLNKEDFLKYQVA